MLRPFPAARDYGSWDELPEPPELPTGTPSPTVADLLHRRKLLVAQWESYRDYPRGVWSDADIDSDPGNAEAWRNWFLRRAWEGVAVIDGGLRREAQATVSDGG